MNVICITEQVFTAPGDCASGIKVGDRHEALSETFGIDKSGARIPCYKLAAFVDTPYVHDQRNFAILPDQSAEEMEEEFIYDQFSC